jgi:hypothetical protein
MNRNVAIPEQESPLKLPLSVSVSHSRFYDQRTSISGYTPLVDRVPFSISSPILYISSSPIAIKVKAHCVENT